LHSPRAEADDGITCAFGHAENEVEYCCFAFAPGSENADSERPIAWSLANEFKDGPRYRAALKNVAVFVYFGCIRGRHGSNTIWSVSCPAIFRGGEKVMK